jgi:hypothetical protein
MQDTLRFNEYGDGVAPDTIGRHVTEFENEELNLLELKQKLRAFEENHDTELAAELRAYILTFKHDVGRLPQEAVVMHLVQQRLREVGEMDELTYPAIDAAYEVVKTEEIFLRLAAVWQKRGQAFKDDALVEFSEAVTDDLAKAGIDYFSLSPAESGHVDMLNSEKFDQLANSHNFESFFD